MESRKKRNQEIERKKRLERRVSSGIVLLMVSLIAIGVIYAIWDTMNRATVMTFNGERIATSDFVYLHTMAGGNAQETEEPNERTLTNMLRILAVLERAKSQGVRADEETMTQIETEAEMIRENFVAMGMNIRATSAQRIADFMSVGELYSKDELMPGPLFTALMEHYMADEAPSEEDTTEYVESRMVDIVDASTETMYRYIAIDSNEAAWAAYQAFIDQEANFAALMSSYHNPQFDEDDEEIPNPINLWDFIINFEAWDNWQEIQELEEGDITIPFQAGELFFIVESYETVLNEELVEQYTQDVTDMFIREHREDLFLDMVDEWVAAASIQKNTRVLNRI